MCVCVYVRNNYNIHFQDLEFVFLKVFVSVMYYLKFKTSLIKPF